MKDTLLRHIYNTYGRQPCQPASPHQMNLASDALKKQLAWRSQALQPHGVCSTWGQRQNMGRSTNNDSTCYGWAWQGARVRHQAWGLACACRAGVLPRPDRAVLPVLLLLPPEPVIALAVLSA